MAMSGIGVALGQLKKKPKAQHVWWMPPPIDRLGGCPAEQVDAGNVSPSHDTLASGHDSVA